MTGKKWFAWVVALAVALPFAATAQDAPGVFKIPGTETTLKIYGFARFDLAYDLNQQNAYATNPLKANISSYADSALTVPSGDPQFADVPMTAMNSRFGFSTTTPSAVGPIGVKVEGDFNGTSYSKYSGTANVSTPLFNVFRLRHGFGTIGSFLTIGQTWSTFRDVSGGPAVETLDWGGNYASGCGRRPQIRATFDLGGATLALGVESPKNNRGGINQIPDVAALVNVPMSWGHVALHGVIEPLKDAAKNSGMGYAVALGGHVNLSGDTLILEVMAGSGAQGYMDFLDNNGTSSVTVGTSITGFQAVSYTVGFTHLWTPTVRTNLIVTGGILKNDQDTRPAAFAANSPAQNFIQGFGNIFYTVAKNADLGIEYTWAQKTDFFNNKYVISRIGVAGIFNFY